MNASEVMLAPAVTLHPDMDVQQAMTTVANVPMDVIPVVDQKGYYHGCVQKSALLDHASTSDCRVVDACCSDALVCAPNFALEHLKHDESSSVPHQTIVVVGDDGQLCGVIPSVHWAVDEAKVQSGHPRNAHGVRTVSMHLTWRCTDCGELVNRNEGLPEMCPVCQAPSGNFALYTED